MKESILDVLLYLFEHVLDDDTDLPADAEARQGSTLLAELTEAGFSADEIHKAFDWLDALAQSRAAPQPARAGGPVRVFAAWIDRLGSG